MDNTITKLEKKNAKHKLIELKSILKGEFMKKILFFNALLFMFIAFSTYAENKTILSISSSENSSKENISDLNKKLSYINKEIESTENNIINGAILFFLAPPLAYGLTFITPGNSTLDIVFLIGGAIIMVHGAICFFEGIFTIGHLKAKKYDLMLLPDIKSEKLVDVNNKIFGMKLELLM